MSPAFLYARGAPQGSVEGPDMWNQVLDTALREPAGRWESEGICFVTAKMRRGSSGDAVKEEGRVLHHLSWADDLYAMAGTMNHFTRILEVTNAIERLGMRWKEKSLTIVAGPCRSTNLERLLRSSATLVDAGSGEWWRAWRHSARGWAIEDARRPVCST